MKRFLLLIVLSSMFSCGRNQDQKYDTVRINIPQLLEKSSNESINYIAVNLSGGDISGDLFKNFDRHDNSDEVYPGVITFPNVPINKPITVQVLAVTEEDSDNDSGDIETFYYGKKNHNFKLNKDAEVKLKVEATKESEEGNISGRYYTPGQGTPTGLVSMYYNPINGDNAMKVGETSMLSGYFNFFLLDDVYLEYRLGTDVIMKEHVQSVTQKLSQKIMGIQIPQHKRVYWSSQDHTNPSIHPQSRVETNFYAFWGDVPQGSKICYAPQAADDIYHETYNSGGNTAINGLYYQFSYSTSTNSQTNTPLRWIDHVLKLGGGHDAETSFCDSGQEFYNTINLNVYNLGESTLALKGYSAPFQLVYTSTPSSTHHNKFFKFTEITANETVKVEWEHMPNMVGPSFVINGVDLFYKKANSSNPHSEFDHLESDRSYNCNLLSAHDFTLSNVSTAKNYTINNLDIDASQNNNGDEYRKYFIILCPYRFIAGTKEYLGNTVASSINL